MPFTVEDIQDLFRLLEQHPEWRDTLRRHVLADELLELPALVRQLALAQARTEQRLDRVEAAIEHLAQAQARTEQRIEELAQIQARTEDRLSRLEGAVDRLAHEVGVLSHVVGATVEESAQDALAAALHRRGFRLLGRPKSMQLDGEGELDAAVEVEGPESQRLWAIAEAKIRLREDDVRAWAHRVWTPSFRARLARFGLAGPYLPYLFGLRLYFSFETIEEEMRAGRLPSVGLLSGREELTVPPALPAA